MPLDTNLSDQELLRLTASGNEEAFAILYRRRQGAVYRFALEMTASTQIAEDVTQEVFMALLRGTTGYDERRGPLASYLYGIARNMVWRHMAEQSSRVPIEEEREDSRTPEHLIAKTETENELMRGETLSALRRAIAVLPAGYREAVVLCDLHELSYAEAASVIGCAVGTVRSRLHRARMLLAERLTARNSSSAGCLV